MKLPKGAEFKSEFPKKVRKTMEPARLESRRIELDALFGDLSEWGRTNGMAVRLIPLGSPSTSAEILPSISPQFISLHLDASGRLWLPGAQLARGEAIPVSGGRPATAQPCWSRNGSC